MKSKKYPTPVLLAMLPKGVAEKAIENLIKYPTGVFTYSDFFHISSALRYGFWWGETKQGSRYWEKIHDILLREGL